MTVDVLIVGAGFAGASTAYHLSEHFGGSILIAERESAPGRHASGRNARLVFQQLEDDPKARSLVIESCQAYLQRADTLGFSPHGSLLLGPRGRLSALSSSPPDSRELSRVEVGQRVPALASHPFEMALWTPTDGVMPVERLLAYYLDGASARGVSLRVDSPVRLETAGPPFRARVGDDMIEAGVVVNACGAWAADLTSSLPAHPSGLRPVKRHLFSVEGDTGPPPETPFVWDLSMNFYLRPEGSGWLISLCEELSDRSPEDVAVEPAVVERLEEILATTLSGLGVKRVVRGWSCFRTHATGGVHIDWDDSLAGLFWVAGLGGNGMGSSWAVGLRAANRLLARL